MKIHELDHIVVNVADVERSLGWYGDLLGLAAERVAEWRAGTAPFPSIRINAGTIIDLMALPRSGENLDHFCLVTDRADVETVAADPRFDVVEGPVERWGARGVGWSVYVRDPDDNLVELRSYG